MHMHVVERIWCQKTLCLGMIEKMAEQGIGDLAEAELDIFQKQLKTPSEVNHLLLTSESLNLDL